MNARPFLNSIKFCSLVCFFLFVPQVARAAQTKWIATWATSPQPVDASLNNPLLKIEDQTVRERVRVSIGGTQIRIRLTNEYSATPLVIGEVTVASPNDAASVKPGSIHKMTFGGSNSVTIAARAVVLSDPVAFPVANGAEITISIYFPNRVTTPTLHWLALKRAVVSQRGDHTGDEKIEDGTVSKASIAISAVLVPAQASQRVVVAFGDSVTDGDGSTLDSDQNWPSQLVRRLANSTDSSKLAVVNEGIAGNRVLNDCFMVEVGCFGVSALARFDRDALALPGVTHIVLLEGINDLGFPGARLDEEYLADPAQAATAEELAEAYKQLISWAHARGVKVIGATITPFEGVDVPGYFSEAKEIVRQAVNKWIRTNGAFDGVIDFDAVLRDPDHPSRLLPKFAYKDHLHPNDAGYQAMANAIDLSLFK